MRFQCGVVIYAEITGEINSFLRRCFKYGFYNAVDMSSVCFLNAEVVISQLWLEIEKQQI